MTNIQNPLDYDRGFQDGYLKGLELGAKMMVEAAMKSTEPVPISMDSALVDANAALKAKVHELEGQLIYSFHEDKYPFYSQGPPINELQTLMTSDEANGLATYICEANKKLKRFEDEAKMYRDRAVAAEDRLKLLEDERVLERKDMEPYFAALKLCQKLDGYTIVDFQQVWLEQERSRVHRLETTLKTEREQGDKYFIKYKILEKAMFDIRAYCIKGEFSSDKLDKIESIATTALQRSS